MLYSQLVQSEYFQKAFQKANVSDIPSPLLERGDFPSGFPDDLFTNPEHKHYVDSLHEITDREILARCGKAHTDQFMKEHEARMKPYREQERKAEFIKPLVEKYLQGKLKPAWEPIQRELINTISQGIAASNQLEVDQDNTVHPVNEHKRDDSLGELENLLRVSSILHLSPTVSVDELVLKTIHNKYYKLLK